MLKNYLLIAFRNIKKYKGFSAINILSLSFSISVCLVIILFVRDQLSYDQFHEKKDRIYRVISDIKMQRRSSVMGFASSSAPLAPVLLNDYPGVEKAVRLRRFKSTAIHDEIGIRTFGVYAESTFFDIFSHKLSMGNPDRVLREPNTAIISSETAQKLFDDTNPIGQTLKLENMGDFIVDGVLAKPPGKSHLDFDVMLSFTTLQTTHEAELRNWRRSIFRWHTYLLLEKETGAAEIESRFPEIVNKNFPNTEPGDIGFKLQAVTDIKLGPNLSNNLGPASDPTLVYILMGLGIIITLSACFNYMNLSIARSLKRAKEVGVRKVVGAHRTQIIRQLLGEAVLVSFISLVVASLFFSWMLPSFNNLSEIQRLNVNLSLDLLNDASVLALFAGFSILIGLLAGIYPAIYLSSFIPAIVIKGLSRIKGFSAVLLRKSLIVVQFALSIIFIISAIMFYRQSEYVLTADYGFNKEHVVNLELQGQSFEAFKNELSKSPDFQSISASSVIPVGGDELVYRFQAPQQEDPISLAYVSIDEHFISNLQLHLLSGRGFSKEFITDRNQALILNESAVTELGLGNPQDAIGETVTVTTMLGESQRRIVGVIKDFHYSSFEDPIQSLVFIYEPEEFNYANIRIRPGRILSAIPALEAAWKGLDKIHPIRYQFYDELVAESYGYLKDRIQVVGLVAVLVVIISCLGLLGMATYTVETKIKEIGVRKVLGASLSNLILLLSGDFMKLIITAVILGIPLAWFLNDIWLQDFAYRIDQGVMTFLFGIMTILFLAFVTICSLTIKAARANPVDTLRYE